MVASGKLLVRWLGDLNTTFSSGSSDAVEGTVFVLLLLLGLGNEDAGGGEEGTSGSAAGMVTSIADLLSSGGLTSAALLAA